MLAKVFFFTTLVALVFIARGKIYTKCELAAALKAQGISEDQIPIWICIADQQSKYNTSAYNSYSGSYGMFQISDRYWCKEENSTSSNICSISCNSLLDDDITNDIICAETIYNVTEKEGYDGFEAWNPAYNQLCNGNVTKWSDNDC